MLSTRKIVCHECGNHNHSDAEFCHICGGILYSKREIPHDNYADTDMLYYRIFY